MSNSPNNSRRDFLKSSTLAAGAVGLSTLTSSVHAAGDDTLRVALIGCGRRGTGAAEQALLADENVKLVAMADAFDDYLQASLKQLKKTKAIADKLDVPKDRQFVGFDAYKQALNSGVDVVLLTTPPHFRPIHLKAAIEAGKHVFAEKPVAVDAQGVRSVIESGKLAKSKGLSIVSGLCLRYHAGFQETVKRLHDQAIGDVHTLMATDYRGPIWTKERDPKWSEMEWQMRMWYYYTWLSGDFNVEQHVHYLDVCAWILGGYPESAVGMGGREIRKGELYGNIYDHHSVTYEYADGRRLFSNTRQQRGCYKEMTAKALGAKGQAEISERRLEIAANNAEKWRHRTSVKNMYQVEHDELFASIRNGKPIDNSEYMAKSTMLAIMGRMATYTGKKVTWEQAMNSKEVLAPEKYEWGDAPKVVIAQPGITKLI